MIVPESLVVANVNEYTVIVAKNLMPVSESNEDLFVMVDGEKHRARASNTDGVRTSVELVDV